MKKQNNATSTVVAKLKKDAYMATKNSYILIFKSTIEQMKCDCLEDVCLELLSEEVDPYQIDMPNGLSIRWNPSLANYFVNKGRMTEKEFINATLIQKGGLQ